MLDLIFSSQSQSEMNSLVLLLIAITYGCYVFGTVFIVCELCERGGNLFNEIDHVVGRLSWYNLPYKAQSMLPTILMMTQRPFKLECFGSIACNRETFKKVSWCKKKSVAYIFPFL